VLLVGIDWAERHHDVCLMARRRPGAGRRADRRWCDRGGSAARAHRHARRRAGRGPGGDRDRPGVAGGGAGRAGYQ